MLVDCLTKNAHSLPSASELHKQCGQLLVKFVLHLKACGPTLPPKEVQVSLDIWKSFIVKARPLSLFTPKCHLLFHLALRMREQGNALVYQCFLDESLNKTLKSVLRFVHQRNFERMGLVKCAETFSRPSKRQRVTN